MHFGVSTLTR